MSPNFTPELSFCSPPTATAGLIDRSDIMLGGHTKIIRTTPLQQQSTNTGSGGGSQSHYNGSSYYSSSESATSDIKL